MPMRDFTPPASFDGLSTDGGDEAEVDDMVKRRRRSSVYSVGSVGSVEADAPAEAAAVENAADADEDTGVAEHIDCATVSAKPNLEHDTLPILSPLIIKLATLDDDARSPDTVVPTDQAETFDQLEPSPAASMATPSPTHDSPSSGMAPRETEVGMYTPCTAKIMLNMTGAGTDTDAESSVRSSMISPSSTASGTPNTSVMGARTPGSEESDTAEMLYSDSDDSHAENSPCHPVHAFSGSPLMSPGQWPD